MTKLLELQLQHQSFQWVFRVDFPEDWLVWSSCCSKDFKESSPAPQFEGINSLECCLIYGSALTAICDHWEDHSLDYVDLTRVMSLFFKVLSRFVIAFLPRSNCLLFSWLQSTSAVILEPKKRKSVTTSTFSTSICYVVMGPDAMILVFLMFSFKPAFSLSSFTLIKRLFSPLHLLPLEWHHAHTWGCWCFSLYIHRLHHLKQIRNYTRFNHCSECNNLQFDLLESLVICNARLESEKDNM